MDRRTFLKAMFAAAVAPPSVVKVLYETKAEALTAEQIINKVIAQLMKDVDLSEYLLDRMFCCGTTKLGFNPVDGIEWTHLTDKMLYKNPNP